LALPKDNKAKEMNRFGVLDFIPVTSSQFTGFAVIVPIGKISKRRMFRHGA
jgi:hypothetical protein